MYYYYYYFFNVWFYVIPTVPRDGPCGVTHEISCDVQSAPNLTRDKETLVELEMRMDGCSSEAV